ncbi:MAG TPA: hypothetical protein VFA06_03070 [Actinocrinis sp.]|uniref:hypothetical protein n=1 Tax=Actinocrinis sp. TaxID=1920516 RepID=UPI002D383831|nr:hypothetical protein [Actinocrinis sp.]HZU54830.1 hypothetical protein [Actinocrinis sp.]
MQQDEPESMGTLPAPAGAAVEAHSTGAGAPYAEGAHTPMHSRVDDAGVSRVAERFEDAPRDAGARQPGQA